MKAEAEKVLAKARRLGADIAGIAPAEPLAEAGAILNEALEGVRSVIVVGVRQSFAALNSPVIQLAQHDTSYAYAKVDGVAHALARLLEDDGHLAIAVPAFLPIDMSDKIKGMLGEVDHRRAAVTAGLGVYGRSNLLVTERYGPRVRLASVMTTASLRPGRALKKDLCADCGECVNACPARALTKPGVTDKRGCGRTVFEYGLRGLMRFAREWTQSDAVSKANLIMGHRLRELWQSFMTGMYYTCFECQAACPVGRPVKGKGLCR
ncbi:MAG: hypothetical protein Kow0099_34870 [Candidatus Abyssubacteria bacterium]